MSKKNDTQLVLGESGLFPPARNSVRKRRKSKRQTDHDWHSNGGSSIGSHTRKKHDVIRGYFREYLMKRCEHPHSDSFRMAIADVCSGANTYNTGEDGSPMIFVKTFLEAAVTVQLKREKNGMKPFKNFECFLLLNDIDEEAINKLKVIYGDWERENRHRLQQAGVHIIPKFFTRDFEIAWRDFLGEIKSRKYTNVIYNIDQCGHKVASPSVIKTLIDTTKSVEVFLTYAIEAKLHHLSQRDENRFRSDMRPLGDVEGSLENIYHKHCGKDEFLGLAENFIYGSYNITAEYVSPFAIYNPDGWQYWLLHLAKKPSARQVYNDVLHDLKGVTQAHYGHSGLKMHSYIPDAENGTLYLFDDDSRASARSVLPSDIEEILALREDRKMTIGTFQKIAYKATPAHHEDIMESAIENPSIEIVTEDKGGKRRKPQGVKDSDVIRMKRQIFFDFGKVRKKAD